MPFFQYYESKISLSFVFLITYYISNSTFSPIDKSAIISIITHFFSSTKAVTIGTVMICDERGITWILMRFGNNCICKRQNCTRFACAITLPIAHAIIPKSHSNPCDYPY